MVELCVSWACLRAGGLTLRVRTLGPSSIFGPVTTRSDLICSCLPSTANNPRMVLQSSRRPWHSSGVLQARQTQRRKRSPFSGHSFPSAWHSRSGSVASPPTSQSPKLTSSLSTILCLSEISRLSLLTPRPVPPSHQSLTDEIFLSITSASELTISCPK